MSLATLSQDVIGRSILLRANRVKSARVIEITVWYLSGVASEKSAPRIKKKVREVYGQVYTIDPLTLFILGIIINTIVKIMIEWWLHNKNVESLKSMQSECTNLQRLLAKKGIDAWNYYR